VELRDIEIFLTLAEELHFGRTAERLHVSQARVSQSIKKQERRVGSPLFERTSRKVMLTPLGAQLRQDLRTGYDAIQGGLAKATAVGHGVRGTLRLGVTAAMVHEIGDILDLFRVNIPGCEVEIRETYFSDPFGPLRTGAVDIAVVWLPVREPDLTTGPVLLNEPLVLAVSSGHALAANEKVTMEDLGDHKVVQSARPIPAYWEEAIHPQITPSGRPIVRGPLVTSWEEVIAAVVTEQAVSCCGAHAIKHHQRQGIVYRTIDDAPNVRWGLIWRGAAETPLIRAFAQAARDIGPSTLERLMTKSAEAPTKVAAPLAAGEQPWN
jgi:DNA-binding transcriptional LysR family regulator